jgi:hypothetical protein
MEARESELRERLKLPSSLIERTLVAPKKKASKKKSAKGKKR